MAIVSKINLVVNEALATIGERLQRRRDVVKVQSALFASREVKTIIDIGANVGDLTARYRAAYPSAHINAFEPFPSCVEELTTRFSSDPRIKIIGRAVADKEGRAKLHVSSGTSAHSLLPQAEEGKQYTKYRVKAEIEVPVTTLDTYLAEAEIDRVEILKIDVEGAEDKVIRGAASALKDGRVDSILMEVMFVPHFHNQKLYHELATMLAEFGYSLFDLPFFKRGKNGQLRWGDALFVSERMRRDIA